MVDGGVSDNIGVRAALELLEELEASAAYSEHLGFGDIRRVILVVVDSHSAPRTDWDKKESPPGFVTQLLQSTNVPIEKYSFETVEIMKDMAQVMSWKRELKAAHARFAGASESQAELSVPTLTLEVIAVSFDEIADP